METEYANPYPTTTFPFFPFFPFKRKGSVFFEGGRADKRVCAGWVGVCGLVGTKRKKRKKRNECEKVIDTQGFGVFRFYSVFRSVFPFRLCRWRVLCGAGAKRINQARISNQAKVKCGVGSVRCGFNA
jgi:hypothetical protein